MGSARATSDKLASSLSNHDAPTVAAGLLD
jgi:hypothetical protein